MKKKNKKSLPVMVLRFLLLILSITVTMIISLVISTTSVYPEVVRGFPGLLKPDGIYVEGNRMIIKEGVTVYVYNLKDFTLIKKFGREGEGPREFKDRIEWIGFRRDYFYAASMGKISYFTLNGDFIKEIRAVSTSGWGFDPLDPLPEGDRFLGCGFKEDGKTKYRTINIYDSVLRIEKEIVKIEDDRQEGKGVKLFTAPQNFGTCDNKIFVAFSNDFLIDVFDIKGNRLFSIKRKYKKLKITNKHRREVLDFFKTNPRTKLDYEWYKQNIKLPAYFPAIRYIYLKEKSVYIRTYEKLDKKTETFIYDMEGKLVKKVFLPVYEENIVGYYSMSISNGKLYQMIENEETELWELHITEIK